MTLKTLSAAAVVLFLAGCNSASDLTREQAAGKIIFDQRCAHCHMENDLALKPAPPNLSRIFNSGKLPSGAPATDAQVIRTVLSGKGKMPSFAGHFTQQQMDGVLAYLHAGVR